MTRTLFRCVCVGGGGGGGGLQLYCPSICLISEKGEVVGSHLVVNWHKGEGYQVS